MVLLPPLLVVLLLPLLWVELLPREQSSTRPKGIGEITTTFEEEGGVRHHSKGERRNNSPTKGSSTSKRRREGSVPLFLCGAALLHFLWMLLLSPLLLSVELLSLSPHLSLWVFPFYDLFCVFCTLLNLTG